jgi:hypothetical protein
MQPPVIPEADALAEAVRHPAANDAIIGKVPDRATRVRDGGWRMVWGRR